MAAVLLIGVVVCVRGRSRWLWLLPVFAAAGFLRAAQVSGECAAEAALGLDGQQVTCSGTVAELSLRGGRWEIVLEECAVTWDPESQGADAPGSVGSEDLGSAGADPGASAAGLGRLLVYVQDTAGERPRIGQRVRTAGTASAFDRARNPGGFDFRGYYRALRLNYRLRGEWLKTEDAAYDRFRDGCVALRLRAGELFLKICGEEDAGIFRAALLGDRAALGAAVRELYQRNGIAHLLAISGLHLSFIGAAAYRGFRRLGLGFGGAGLCGAVLLTGYVVFTGEPPSVTRAAAMLVCSFLAAYLGRTYDLLSALSLAAVLVLWQSPYRLTQAGVQLSFAAVAGIGGVAPCLMRAAGAAGRKTREPDDGKAAGRSVPEDGGKAAGRSVPEDGRAAQWAEAVLQTMCVSLGLQLATMPVVLYHFYQLPLYGVFLNLVAVPLMGIVLASGGAGLLLGLWLLKAGQFAIASGRAVLALYEALCRVCETLPFGNLILGRPGLWQIGLYYGLLAVLLKGSARRGGAGVCAAAGVRTGTGIPGRDRLGHRVWRAFLPFLLLPALLLPLPARGLTVTFLDVGQGDGICLHTAAGTVLVDGGSSDETNLGEDCLEAFLKCGGVRTVDYAVVSHGDADHISGLSWLLEYGRDISVRCLVLPAAGAEDGACLRLAELAAARGTKVMWMEAGQSVAVGRLVLTCLYPPAAAESGGEREGAGPGGQSGDAGETDRNEQSLVLRADYGDFHLLLTGDMSGDGEARLLADAGAAAALEGIQVLKVAHHGSRYSTTERWLDAVGPRWAVISCGEENSYGHPHAEVLERLAEHGVSVRQTDGQGAVILHTDGSRIRWQSFP